MNKEQAIKELNEIRELVEEDLKYDDYEASVILDQIDLKALIIVLDLLENQQKEIETLKRDFEIVDHECSRLEQEDIKKDKEIEKLKNNNKDLLRKLRNRVKEVKKLEKYSLYKKEFATLNKRIEKKEQEIKELKKQLISLTYKSSVKGRR